MCIRDSAGTAKASWIADTFNISKTSVKNARRELIALGFITPDQTESQRKLNRSGAYFSINLAWNYQQKDIKECRDFAPLSSEKCRDFAPLIKKQVTPYRTLETNKPAKRASGFCRNKISFRNIKPEQIQKIPLLLMLYRSATQQKALIHSERNLLSFFSAAVKAKRGWTEPVRMFVWTVRNDFKYITEGDEKRAISLIKNYRRNHPKAFEFLDDTGDTAAPSSEQKARINEMVSDILKTTQAVA